MMAYFIIGLYLVALLLIFLFSLSQLQLTFAYLKNKKKEVAPLPTTPETWPMVTIQLPLYNEKYVAERLIDCIAQLDYPKDKLEIQLLDDSTDETTELLSSKIVPLQAQGLDIQLIRRHDRSGFKAGALAYGLKKAKGTFIAIFDADFVPQPDFLLKTIPHFQDHIGLVQTRWGHLNENYSLLTRLQAFGLDAHFTIEQIGRNSSNSFINFNGTAGVWRKETIIDAGGWSADTLTEDLDLSYRAQLKGWKFHYMEEVVAPAELPIIMPAIKSQQYRWNKGGAENAKKHMATIWRSALPVGNKLHAFFHLFNSSIFIVILVAALLSLPVLYVFNLLPELSFLAHLGSVFLFGFFSIGFFYYISFKQLKPEEGLFTFFKTFSLFIIMSMGLSWHNAGAVLSGLRGKKSAFIRTPKFNISQKSASWLNNQYININWRSIHWLEGILMCYFAFGIYLGIYLKQYLLLPFHIMLCMGFGLVFLYSIIPFYENIRKTN